jgi:hypothetical protein
MPSNPHSKDRNFGGDRYCQVANPTGVGERISIEVECLLCIEADNEMYTKYAHPKAHLEAHTQATRTAETLAIKEKTTEDYLSYYIFHYGREYTKIYKNVYDKYKNEYSEIVLGRTYDKKDIICDYHQESIGFHHEFKKEEEREEEEREEEVE